MTTAQVTAFLALGSIALFVVGLKRLSKVRTARSGNALMAGGMLLAVVLTLVEIGTVDYRWIIAGLVIGGGIGYLIVARAQATQMPQIVARFNGFGGSASALVALSLFWGEVVQDSAGTTAAQAFDSGTVVTTLVLSVLIGASTLSGSILAELKLRGTISGTPRVPVRALLMGLLLVVGLAMGYMTMYTVEDAGLAAALMIGLFIISLLIGLVLVLPIGGADMPVVISLLNSLSGLAAAAAGFALSNNLLIIAGTIVGAAGLILTQIMCMAMNRSLLNVIIGGYGGDGGSADDGEYTNVVSSDAESAAMVLEAAQSVIIVPGYGLAASRGQNAAHDLARALIDRGTDVKFAIHPVAGRMPGHMNVVLAEAEVPYELLYEMDAINPEFPQTDVAIVVGANDVVNPAANDTPGSPIAGMPILDVKSARRVFVIKRSLAPGYAGIKNELFELDHTVLLYGDAKEVLTSLATEVSGAK